MNRPIHGGNLGWAAELAQCAPEKLLDFSANISPLGPPYSVMKAVRAAFSSVAEYPDPDYLALRKAIAHHHALPIDYIFPGNGAAELLNWAARELAQMKGCFCLSPGFADYARSLHAYSCNPTYLPLLNLSLPNKQTLYNQPLYNQPLYNQPIYNDAWETLLREIAAPADCGLLLNNPHNPTGLLFERAWVRSLIKQFGLVVVDEAFMDFFPNENTQSVISEASRFPKNLVVIRSLTKFYSIPGIRLGYAVAHPDRLKEWRKWRDPWAVNSLAAAAGIAGLQDTEFQQRSWAWLAKENPFLFEGLSRFEALSPMAGSANFLLVKCEVSVMALQRKLLQQHRIYIRDCMSFEGLGDRFFRVAVKTREDNRRLLTAIADVLPDLEPNLE